MGQQREIQNRASLLDQHSIPYESYLLQHGVLLLGGQPQVPLLAGAELGSLLLELLLALLHCADLLAPKPLQGLDELLVRPLQLQAMREQSFNQGR